LLLPLLPDLGIERCGISYRNQAAARAAVTDR
jgi:hypothetical protein